MTRKRTTFHLPGAVAVVTGGARGIGRATALAFRDAGALVAVGQAFRARPDADVISGGCIRFYADGSRVETAVSDRFLELMTLRNPLEQPSTFWRARLHRAAGELEE